MAVIGRELWFRTLLDGPYQRLWRLELNALKCFIAWAKGKGRSHHQTNHPRRKHVSMSQLASDGTQTGAQSMRRESCGSRDETNRSSRTTRLVTGMTSAKLRPDCPTMPDRYREDVRLPACRYLARIMSDLATLITSHSHVTGGVCIGSRGSGGCTSLPANFVGRATLGSATVDFRQLHCLPCLDLAPFPAQSILFPASTTYYRILNPSSASQRRLSQHTLSRTTPQSCVSILPHFPPSSRLERLRRRRFLCH